MGGILVIMIWGIGSALIGAIYNSIIRMYSAKGFLWTFYEGMMGVIWGSMIGLIIG